MSKNQFLPKLTQREREILPFMLEGVSRKKIAQDLGISTETVKNHIRNTRRKFEDCTVSETSNAMVLYQMYYGVGGAGLDRYYISTEYTYTVKPDLSGGLCTLERHYLVVNGPFEGEVITLAPGDYVQDVEIEGMFLKAKRHSGPMLYLDLDKTPVARTGEEFHLKARYRFMNDPIEYRDYFKSTIRVPTSKFTFRIIFEGDTPPQSCILSHCKTGITTKSINWTNVRRGQIFEHREINPSVGTEVRADWIW